MIRKIYLKYPSKSTHYAEFQSIISLYILCYWIVNIDALRREGEVNLNYFICTGQSNL